MSALLNLPVSQLDTTSIINSRAPPSRNVPVRDSPRCSWGRTYVSSSPHRWQLQSAANGASASVGTSSEQLTSQPLQLRVRSATEADLPSIAHLFGQTFAYADSRRATDEDGESAAVQLLRRAEDQYATAIEREMNSLLLSSLQKKAQKSAEARDYRAWRRLQQLNAEIAALRGKQYSLPTPVTPVERRQLDAWRRARTFAVLLAEDVSSHRLAGAATVSLTAAEAFLPPPFPTLAKPRLYVGNMAVASTDRRRGVASKLLEACETLGRRWGYSSMWLHFDRGNDAAEALYVSRGFDIVREDPVWRVWPKRRSLLCKELVPVAPWPIEKTVVSGDVRSEDGVFVWKEDVFVK